MNSLNRREVLALGVGAAFFPLSGPRFGYIDLPKHKAFRAKGIFLLPLLDGKRVSAIRGNDVEGWVEVYAMDGDRHIIKYDPVDGPYAAREIMHGKVEFKPLTEAQWKAMGNK